MNEEILENVNDRLDDAIEQGRYMIENDDLPEQVEEFKQQAESVVRQHPFKCLAGGLLAGFIVGKLLSSDS